jgi:hypothetical protein
MLLESMISILEHSAPIQLNVLIVESHPEPMDVDVTKRPIDLRLSLDRLYNMIVCKDCCIGLPSEWVPAHLRENHDIIVTDKQVKRFLALENDAMTVEQVEEWRQSIWVGRAVENIPITGPSCGEVSVRRFLVLFWV